MANCHIIRRQLEAVEYDTDALPPNAADHLTQCIDCRTFASQMQGLRALLADQPRVAPPATFDAEIRLRLSREAHRFQDPWPAWIPTPVLASIAAAVVVASALAVRSSMPLALQTPAPTITEALTKPTLPDQTLATTLRAQLGATTPTARPVLPPRALPAATRLGRAASASFHPSPPAETAGMVVLWRGRSGERIVRLPKVIYGVQPVVERRAASSNGEASDDSVF